MIAILSLLLPLPLWAVLSWLFALIRNYRAAKASGLPVVVSPFNPTNPIYMVVKTPLRSVLEKVFPIPGVKLSIFGWDFLYKYAPHQQHGRTFILVNSGSNELWCADPAMAQVILTRRKDFVQLPLASKVMSIQGENLISSDGRTWARQRRLIAPNLNERISEVVWNETTRQACQMLDSMLEKGESDDTVDSLRAIAINVLARVAYGQQKVFTPAKLPTNPNANVTYTEAVHLCADLILFAALMPTRILTLTVMPKVLQTLGSALQKLPGLTNDMLEQERHRQASGLDTSTNLMSMLVHLSDSAKKGGLAGAKENYLTENEISGNLFLFTLAGFDTTAATLAYGISLLAAYPEWQTWVQEEIDYVLGDANPEPHNPQYAAVFPQLNRCLAIMLETIRLYPVITHLSRGTIESQTIVTSEGTYHLKGAFTVYVNSMSLHTWPSIWGEDSLCFRPSRWILPGAAVELGKEQLLRPARGTFLPWGEGPRACPGMKMAHVEFVAVLATFLRRCNIEPVAKPGENIQQARARLVDVTQDSLTRMTLQMNKPKEVHLRWLKR